MKIPAGAVATQTDIEFIEYSEQEQNGMVMLSHFELNAKETITGKSFSNFDKNLEISFVASDEELAGIETRSLRLYYLDEKKKQRCRWLIVNTILKKKLSKLLPTISVLMECRRIHS